MKNFKKLLWNIITLKKIRVLFSNYRARNKQKYPWIYYYIDKKTGEKVRYPIWVRLLFFLFLPIIGPAIKKYFWDRDKDDDNYRF